MIVSSLTLKNFRSYQGGRKVDFDTGITMIIGENGSGKSSILEAINFALFRDRSLTASETTTLGNRDIDVTLEFRCDHRDYKVSRGKQGGKNYDILYERRDEEWVQSTFGKKDTNDRIEEILCIGRDVFQHAVYIRQGEIDRILSEDTDRKNLVGKILGIEQIEAAWQSLGREDGVIGTFRAKANQLQGEIFQKGVHEAEKAEKESNIARDRQIHGQLLEEKGKNLATKDEKQKVLDQLDKNENNNITFTTQRNSLKDQMDVKGEYKKEQESRLSKISEAEARNAAIESDVKKLGPMGQLRDVNVSISQNLATLKIVDDDLRKIGEWKDTIKSHKDDHDSYERLDKDRKTLEDYRPRINKSNKSLAKHNQQLVSIAEWKSGIDQHTSDYTEYEAIGDKLEFLNSHKTRVGRHIANIGTNQMILNNIATWRSDVEKNLGAFEKYESLAASMGVINEQVALIKSALKDIDNCEQSLRDILKYRKEMEESKPVHDTYLQVKGRLGELEEKAKGVRGSDTRYRDAEESLETKRGERDALEGRIQNREEEYCQGLGICICEPLQLKEQATAILEEKKASLQALTNRIEGLDATLNQLRGNKKSLSRSMDSLDKVEGDRCPTCGSDLSAEKKEEIIEHFRVEIDVIQSQITETDRQARSIKREKTSLDGTIDKIRAMNVDMLLKDQGDLEERGRELSRKAADLESLRPLKESLEKIEKEMGLKNKSLTELEPSYLKYMASERYLADKDEAAIRADYSKYAQDVYSAIDIINNTLNGVATIPRSLDKKVINDGVKQARGILTSEQSLAKDGHDTYFVAQENLKTVDEDALKRSLQESHDQLFKEMEEINQHLEEGYAIPQWNYQDLILSIEDRSQKMSGRMEILKDSHDEYVKCRKNLSEHKEEAIKEKIVGEETKLSQTLEELNGKFVDPSSVVTWNKGADLPETLDEKVKTIREKMDALKEAHDKYRIAKSNLEKSDEEGLTERRSIITTAMTENTETRTAIIGVLGYEPEDVDDEYKRLGELNNEYQLNQGIIQDKTTVQKNISEANAQLTELAGSIAALDQSIRDLGYDPEAHKKAKAEVTKADEALQQTQSRIDGLATQIQMLVARVKEIEQTLAEIGAKEAELKRLTGFIDLLTDIRSVIHKDRLQSEIRRRSIPAISRYANELFQSFNLPYYSLTITDDYSLILHGTMGDYSVNMMSGGEKVAASLALRVGMARALLRGNLEMLILDEPTAHLDDERRRELATVIRNLVQIPQTIVVTHDEEFDQAATTVIHVRKENGVSILEMG